MSRPNPIRWLPVPALRLAVLVLTTAMPVFCQTPSTAHPAANSTASPASGISAAHGPAQPTAQAAQTLPLPNSTPEEIGDFYQARQRYQAAIAAYSKEPHPTALVWNKMGIAYQMMFNSHAATHCYQESLRLDQKNPMVFNNMATVYDSLKEYSKAEKMYHKALKINPNSPMILKNLGTNLLVQHKYSKGWKAYGEAMRLDPMVFEDHDSPTVSNPTSIQQRGALNYFMARGCARMGQTACALEYLRMAINEGYTTIKKVAEDADFASLRDNPGFKQFAAEQGTAPRHP